MCVCIYTWATSSGVPIEEKLCTPPSNQSGKSLKLHFGLHPINVKIS